MDIGGCRLPPIAGCAAVPACREPDRSRAHSRSAPLRGANQLEALETDASTLALASNAVSMGHSAFSRAPLWQKAINFCSRDAKMKTSKYHVDDRPAEQRLFVPCPPSLAEAAVLIGSWTADSDKNRRRSGLPAPDEIDRCCRLPIRRRSCGRVTF